VVAMVACRAVGQQAMEDVPAAVWGESPAAARVGWRGVAR